MKRQLPLLRFVLVLYTYIFCSIQVIGQSDLGIRLRLNSQLGTHVHQLGFSLDAFYDLNKNTRFSAGIDVSRFWKDFGINGAHNEIVLRLGSQYSWGENDDIQETFIKYMARDSLHQSVQYTWERFFNAKGTQQNVGTFGYRYSDWFILFSNDALANFNGKDRYRTGAMSIGMYEDDAVFYSSLRIWTGDTHCQESEKIKDSNYPARYGYRDISDCHCGKQSHGVWSIGLKYDVGEGQLLGAELGADAEQIRHRIQNVFFHDLYWIPEFMQGAENLHLPMKQKDGSLYLFRDKDEVRPVRFFGQLGGYQSLMF